MRLPIPSKYNPTRPSSSAGTGDSYVEVLTPTYEMIVKIIEAYLHVQAVVSVQDIKEFSAEGAMNLLITRHFAGGVAAAYVRDWLLGTSESAQYTSRPALEAGELYEYRGAYYMSVSPKDNRFLRLTGGEREEVIIIPGTFDIKPSQNNIEVVAPNGAVVIRLNNKE